jgi:hypothetical protein
MDLLTEGKRPPVGHACLVIGVPHPVPGATELNADRPRPTLPVPPDPLPLGEA